MPLHGDKDADDARAAKDQKPYLVGREVLRKQDKSMSSIPSTPASTSTCSTSGRADPQIERRAIFAPTKKPKLQEGTDVRLLFMERNEKFPETPNIEGLLKKSNQLICVKVMNAHELFAAVQQGIDNQEVVEYQSYFMFETRKGGKNFLPTSFGSENTPNDEQVTSLLENKPCVLLISPTCREDERARFGLEPSVFDVSSDDSNGDEQ